MPIARHKDGKHASVMLKQFGTDGVFTVEGKLVKGKMGTATEAEIAFRIWFQSQDVELPRAKAIAQWNALCPNLALES